LHDAALPAAETTRATAPVAIGNQQMLLAIAARLPTESHVAHPRLSQLAGSLRMGVRTDPLEAAADPAAASTRGGLSGSMSKGRGNGQRHADRRRQLAD
jgi:hypothetical protein